MPAWNADYFGSLRERFANIIDGLNDRLESEIAEGRVAPAVDDLTIGTARHLRAAVLFFDIRHFSERTGSAELQDIKRALQMLDAVVPLVMQVIFDHGGYIEKNTGDGVMAIIGADKTDGEAAGAALDIAVVSFYVLTNLVNPYLTRQGIAAVDARIGIDLGSLLLARIGLPTGTAKHERSFLTAVGPSANLAFRLQQMAGTNQIWVGANIKAHAGSGRQGLFVDVTPAEWTWHYKHDPQTPYKIWHFNAVRRHPS